MSVQALIRDVKVPETLVRVERGEGVVTEVVDSPFALKLLRRPPRPPSISVAGRQALDDSAMIS